MLKVENEKQGRYIESLDFVGYVFDDGTGVRLNDDVITFDEMAMIVDYLRTSDNKDDLFETCWIAYRRKGSKKKAKEYWRKLTDAEKENVLAHVKVYVKSRDLCYQKDFERYLRDKAFNEIIINGNNVVYDPTKLGKGEMQSTVYMPTCDGALSWNDYYSAFIFVGYWDGRHIPDGYDDETRPDGASVTLNNGRGVLVWNKETKQWENTRQ